MDKEFDLLLKNFNLEFSDMRSRDGSWHFKRISGHWHFKDTRMRFDTWMYFDYLDEISDIVYSPLTIPVPGIVYRTEHTCEPEQQQVYLGEITEDPRKDDT